MIWFAAGLAVGIVLALIAIGLFAPNPPRRSQSRAEIRSRAAHATAAELVEPDPEWDTEPANLRILSQDEATRYRMNEPEE